MPQIFTFQPSLHSLHGLNSLPIYGRSNGHIGEALITFFSICSSHLYWHCFLAPFIGSLELKCKYNKHFRSINKKFPSAEMVYNFSTINPWSMDDPNNISRMMSKLKHCTSMEEFWAKTFLYKILLTTKRNKIMTGIIKLAENIFANGPDNFKRRNPNTFVCFCCG